VVLEGLVCVPTVEDVPVELFVEPSVVCGDVPVSVESFVVPSVVCGVVPDVVESFVGPPVVCAMWKYSAEMLNQIF
jgi:hypothetical protein